VDKATNNLVRVGDVDDMAGCGGGGGGTHFATHATASPRQDAREKATKSLVKAIDVDVTTSRMRGSVGKQ
jgi:hypothetical protein